jgi:hypothetical protein
MATLPGLLLASSALSSALGAYLPLDEAVRLVLSSSALYRNEGSGQAVHALLKTSLLCNGCPPHLRTRCVAAWQRSLKRSQGLPLPALTPLLSYPLSPPFSCCAVPGCGG